MRMTSKAVNTGSLPKQTKDDRTLSYDTGSHNVHNDKCRRNSKSAKARRESSSKSRHHTKSADKYQTNTKDEGRQSEETKEITELQNDVEYSATNHKDDVEKDEKLNGNDPVGDDMETNEGRDLVLHVSNQINDTVTGAEAMKSEPKEENKESSPDEHSDLDKEIDIVAKENGNVEHKTKRIDNGMLVRNKKIGGRSPKVIRRYGNGSPSRYHSIRPSTVGAPAGKSILSRSSHRDSNKSSIGFRRTVSRGDKKGRPGSETSAAGGDKPARAESDDESTATHATFDTDFNHVDISADSGWDTDLEAEEDNDAFEGTLKAVYVESCKKAGVIPASYFLRHMEDSEIEMKHHGLGPQGVKPIAIALVSNTKVLKLNLTDNWLGREGGQRVCDMLTENCYIADLDLSDNRLGLHFAQSFVEVLKHNSSITHITLTGNFLDDRAAVYIAEAIMNSYSLIHMNLSRNLFGEQAGILLGPAISENSSLKSLDLSWNGIRRKGAKAIAEGIKSNVLLQSVNLSWNGFGSDGAKWLGEALKVNSALEELDISNNRITTEGAVLLGKGISVNESLKVLKMGKNPMQSAGCFALCTAVLKNPNSLLHTMDFTDIMVNTDFHDVFNKVKEQLPSLRIRHGGDSLPKKPRARVHPMVKLQNYIQKRNLRMIDFFNQFDKDGSMSVTRDEFAQGLEESGIKLTVDEVNMLLNELDKDGDGEINYSELVIGHQDFAERERKMASSGPLMQT